MAGYRANRARRLAALSLAAAAVLAAACGSSRPGSVERGHPSGTVVVLAAASLKSAFDTIGKDFEKAYPDVTVKFSYGGSSTLATSIKQGAISADVFASASTTNMDTVSSDRLTASTPQIFVKNKLEIMTKAGNPQHIKSVSDLAKPSVKVAVCAPAVPCGSYSKQVFQKAGVTVKPVSQETSVTGVVAKVSLGDADAGVVYATDVKAGGSKVTGVPIPAKDNVVADYPIARLSGAPNVTGASVFVRYVLGTQAQDVLASYGFIPASH